MSNVERQATTHLRMMPQHQKAAKSSLANPSLVSPNIPTLANPTRGFDVLLETTKQQSSNLQQEQPGSEQLLENRQKLSPSHDISRIPLRSPAKITVGKLEHNSDAEKAIMRQDMDGGVPATSNQAPQDAGLPGGVPRSQLSQELEQVWNTQGKGAFFERLRNLTESQRTDPNLNEFVNNNLHGDDQWLAQKLLAHGAEANWPIHLRVEREMKGWGDSGGKGVVFEILRAANGTQASNGQLTATLNQVFASGSDDLWLAQNLQAHGAEANWPIRLRIERDLKPWGGGAAAALSTLESADAATLSALRADVAFLNSLQTAMDDALFARAAALFVLVVPGDVVDRAAARTAALQIVTVQLSNKAIARSSIDNRVQVIVIPRNKLMTDVAQFASLAGQTTFDGRHWETVRGSGGMQVGGSVCTAITEENLLGGDCTATFNGTPVSGTYTSGYSTSTHEFAHTLHLFVLNSTDKAAITGAYNARKVTAQASPTDQDQWVDGRQGCYASQTEEEFFAQLSNAYLGTNAGTDPATGDPRHNGKSWVNTHEPVVFQILERMYKGGSVPNANPPHP